MEVLQAYLAKYKNLTPPEASKIRCIAKVIENECGILLPESTLLLRRGGVFAECHPAIKSELSRHAGAIIHTLHSEYQIRITFIR